MKKIIINAYACAPNQGSEPGMAWNWIIHLAKYCKLFVITEGEWKDQIELELKEIEYADNITFYFNPVSEKVRKMCWNQGDWRFYYFYKKWQKSTLKIAQGILDTEHIDLIHQLNMIGFREPGYLWKIEKIPFVWGPIDAKEGFPVGYLSDANVKLKFFIKLKNLLTRLQLKYSNRVKLAIENSDYLIAATSDSANTISKYFDKQAVLINETGCKPRGYPIERISYSKKLKLLWVGKTDYRKQLNLALRTISKLKFSNDIELHIIGNTDEDADKNKQLLREMNIEQNCVWHGKVPHEKVQIMMQESDLFFFTSVAEGTPHVVLEAITNQLPVLCFDTCGQGDIINSDIGIKIKLTDSKRSIQEFSLIIDNLNLNRGILNILSDNCFLSSKNFSWETRAKEMFKLYSKLD